MNATRLLLLGLAAAPSTAWACTITSLTPVYAERVTSSPSFTWSSDCVEHRLWTWPAGNMGARRSTAWFPDTSWQYTEDAWDALVAADPARRWAVEGRAADGTPQHYSAQGVVQIAHDDDDDGFAAEDLDCDDLEPTVYPGAPETCGDGIDSDCDGVDGCYASIAGTHSLDEAETSLVSLTPAANLGFRVVLDDLDADGLAEIFALQNDNSPGGGGATWVVDAPGVGVFEPDIGPARIFGGSGFMDLSVIGDIDGDGEKDLLISEPYASWRYLAEGVSYLVRGPFVGTTDFSAAQAQLLGADHSDHAGRVTPHGVGDVNGDGLDDLLIGAPDHDWFDPTGFPFSLGNGSAYLFLGPGPSGSLVMENSADLELMGAHSPGGPQLGSAPGSTDWNADGLPDILLDEQGRYGTGTERGALQIVESPPVLGGSIEAEFIGVATIEGADGDLLGPGYATVGDLDGDGIEDLAIGAPFSDLGGVDSGAVYIVPMNAAVTGLVSAPALAVATLVGEGDGDWAGSMITALGDFDGDGFADIALTAPTDNVAGYNSGSVYIALGPFAGTSSLGAAASQLVGVDTNCCWDPFPIDGGKDIDGDGLPDLVVGTPTAGVNDEGALWVFYGGSL